jgi:hypothetical protein
MTVTYLVSVHYQQKYGKSNVNLLTDSQNILNMWKNYFTQPINIHRVHNLRQTEIHTAGPLIPEPSPLKTVIAIAKLKRYKTPGTNQILEEVMQNGGKTL